MIANVRDTAKWALPSLVLAVVLGFTIGFLPGWIAYWAFNVAGVWMYCDDRGHHSLTMQKWLKRLSFVLLPSGVLGLMAGGELGPSQTVGAGNDATRVGSAQAASGISAPEPGGGGIGF